MSSALAEGSAMGDPRYSGHELKSASPLDIGLNVAVLQVASQLFPCGFDVSLDAPHTYEALKVHLDAGGRMVVWSGGAEATIFADREVNYAFRAWLSFCHWRGGYSYTPEGEQAAHEMQCQHIFALYGDSSRTRRWCALLRAEMIGPAEFCRRNKRVPENRRAFLEAYVTNPDKALGHPW
jgi:hypothetical protein